MGIDFYVMLDVKPEATPAEIRTAYFKLAKELHPDRQASSDPNATERFLAVQTAYEILIDPARREDYDRQRLTAGAGGQQATATQAPPRPATAKPASKGRATPSLDDERDARLAFQKAMNLMESGQNERAMRAMQVVVRAVPDRPEYPSLLGYLMACEGEKLHAARDYCRQAVEAEPYNPDFHARLGFVYLRAGLNNTAQQCFEQALQLDPSHELAKRHVGKPSSADSPGLMGSIKKLFGSRN